MASQKTVLEDDVPVKQVNVILQNLRGEHFRHTRNVRGKAASSSSLSSQPSLPINLIYPSPAPAISPSWVPGPSLPKSWRSPATSTPSSLFSDAKNDGDVTHTPAWRARALSPLFSAVTPPLEGVRFCPIYPDPGLIPRLTLLCLQLIRSTCLGTDLADVVPYIPGHLCRALLRYAAVHAPLSQTELGVLCQGSTHVDTELVVVGPHNSLRASSFHKNEYTTDSHPSPLDHADNESCESWDAVQTHDDESLSLRSLAIVSSPLNAATMLAFPPTITHLALIDIPHRISLQRLPTICPLLVFLDLSYNAWLYAVQDTERAESILEVIEWGKFRRLEVIGLRECPVTQKVLLELNRGRWEDVRVIQ